MPTLTCSLDGCDKEFYKKPYHIKKNNTGNFYCSQSCYGKTLGKQKKEYTCIICNIMFLEYPSQRKNNKNKCCSKKCADILKTKYPKTIHLRSIIQSRKYNEKCRKQLTDEYVKSAFTQISSLRYSEIPQELIETKRAALKAYRQFTQS